MQPIADFSELGDFLDMPVRYYSAGMKVRLAFSIATAIEPEVLLVDEVLSVGDMVLSGKGRPADARYDGQGPADRAGQPRPGVASRNCATASIWLDHGRVRMVGDPAAVVAAYTGR